MPRRPTRPTRPAPAPPPIEIRPATPDDGVPLGRLGATLARLHHRMDRRRFFVTERMEDGYGSWLAKESRNRKAVVLVAEALGRGGKRRIVGFAYGKLEGVDWNSLRGPAGIGVDVYVVPSARRNGVARQLVKALVDALAERGAPQIVIQVAARNARALQVFERMGFRRTLVELVLEP